MNKFHSTVSRRDFMKGLGLAGVGLGAAAATTPVIHDLDELAGAAQSTRNLPWYIKERDFENPTVEVDWSILNWNSGAARALRGPRELPEEIERRNQLAEGFIRDMWNTPGMTHKDHALQLGCRPRMRVDEYGTEMRESNNQTFEDMNLPRWSGTPEENMRMVTAALHFWGSGQVGCVEINSKTMKADYDREISPGDPAKYALTYIVPQSAVSKYQSPGGFGILHRCCTQLGYSNGSIISTRIRTFLRTLGYMDASDGDIKNVAIGVLSGNGELPRTDFLCSPEYGTMVRYSAYRMTDLPLAPTKPIDAGIHRFCKTCKICAETCPADCISLETDPTWEPSDAQNAVGTKKWGTDFIACKGYRNKLVPGGCSNCMAACPFNSLDLAGVHTLVKAALATTGIFNGFFTSMEKTFGYSDTKEPEDFWEALVDAKGVMAPWGRYTV